MNTYRVKAEIVIQAKNKQEARALFWEWLDEWIPGINEDNKLVVLKLGKVHQEVNYENNPHGCRTL